MLVTALLRSGCRVQWREQRQSRADYFVRLCQSRARSRMAPPALQKPGSGRAIICNNEFRQIGHGSGRAWLCALFPGQAEREGGGRGGAVSCVKVLYRGVKIRCMWRKLGSKTKKPQGHRGWGSNPNLSISPQSSTASFPPALELASLGKGQLLHQPSPWLRPRLPSRGVDVGEIGIEK